MSKYLSYFASQLSDVRESSEFEHVGMVIPENIKLSPDAPNKCLRLDGCSATGRTNIYKVQLWLDCRTYGNHRLLQAFGVKKRHELGICISGLERQCLYICSFDESHSRMVLSETSPEYERTIATEETFNPYSTIDCLISKFKKLTKVPKS